MTYTINDTYLWKIIVNQLVKHYGLSILMSYEWVVSYLAKFLRDMFVVIIVKSYYDHHSFWSLEDFLSKKWFQIILDYSEFSQLCIRHFSDVDMVIDNILKEFVDWKILNIEVMWDWHPAWSTKLMITTEKENYLLFKSIHDSQNSISSFLCSIDPDLQNCFVSWKKRSNYWYRQMFDIVLNWSSEEGLLKYYYLFWRILPWLCVFKISDQYHENILCSFPYPKIFDIEVMFLSSAMPYNLSTIGILAQDDSSFASINWDQNLMSYTVPLVTYENSLYWIEWIANSKSFKQSIPLNEIGVSFKFLKEQLLCWYNDGVQKINESLLKIKEFVKNSDINTRIIVRPTREYIMLLKLYQYGLIKDKNLWLMKWLDKNLWTQLYHPQILSNNNLFIEEKNFLYDWIIPICYSNIFNKNIILNNLVVGENFIGQYDDWLMYIDNIDDFFVEQYTLLNDFFV